MDAARAPSGHGCPFGAGPRSGTGVKEPDEVGPNQEQAPLVTWGAFPSNSPKAKHEAVRPRPLTHIKNPPKRVLKQNRSQSLGLINNPGTALHHLIMIGQPVQRLR